MKQLLIVTGHSGAGKSIALKALEDVGYVAIDNLPMGTLGAVLESVKGTADYVAVGLDIRSHGFDVQSFIDTIESIRSQPDLHAQLLFLVSDADALLGRFKETRRPHPLTPDRPVMDGILLEHTVLEPIRGLADEVVDTTRLTPRDLGRHIQGLCATGQQVFAVQVMSFSYKYGLPREADLVIDVRFLQNPHYVEALRPLTGKDAEVAEYIRGDKDFPTFEQTLWSWLHPLLPRYREEGKRLLTLAFGCTGGRHRSVFLTEDFARRIEAAGYSVISRHRELPHD